MGDRSFNLAFGLSLTLHLTLLSGTFMPGQGHRYDEQLEPMELIYEQEQVQVRHFEEQLARLRDIGFKIPAAKQPSAKPVVRIPQKLPVVTAASTSDPVVSRTLAVDLTDLINASQGDPVLLGYYGAIREQIQRVATKNASLFANETTEGLIYVSFVLAASGHIEQSSILMDRSVDSKTLQQAAIQIVRKAAPFLPFPPSIKEARTTILVPLEFFR